MLAHCTSSWLQKYRRLLVQQLPCLKRILELSVTLLLYSDNDGTPTLFIGSYEKPTLTDAFIGTVTMTGILGASGGDTPVFATQRVNAKADSLHVNSKFSCTNILMIYQGLLHILQSVLTFIAIQQDK